MSTNLGLTIGPLLAGVLIDQVGYGWTYSIEAVLLVVAFTTLVSLPPLPPEGRIRRAGLTSVLEGLSYLRTRPNVRMTFLVDMAAMILAMPRVLFPAIAATLLGGGSTTVGILVAGMATGSVLAGLFSGPLGHVRRQGRAVLVAVVGWGLAVTAFGVVLLLTPTDGAVSGDGGAAHWALWPAVFCMALAGAADTVSAVFRMTILQAATPDEMRGRLQGVFIVVVAGGPRLGDLVLGSMAEISSEALAAVAGGLLCIAVVVALALTQRRFARYDALDPTPEMITLRWAPPAPPRMLTWCGGSTPGVGSTGAARYGRARDPANRGGTTCPTSASRRPVAGRSSTWAPTSWTSTSCPARAAT